MGFRQPAQIVKKLTGGGTGSSSLGSIHKYAEKVRKKRNAVLNQEFLVLQTIAILSVVIGHGKEGAFSFFSDWFPIYSYHMPLFVFISGYFYRINSEEKIFSFILRKAKTLLLPYFLWRIVYAAITTLLLNANVIAYGKPFSLYNFFVDPWVHEDSFILMLPAWFVPALFCVQVVFVLLRKLFGLLRFRQELLHLLLFLLAGLAGVYAARVLWETGTAYGAFSTPIRVAFFLPFYQLGFLYKKYLEQKLFKNYLLYFSVIFLVQMCLLKGFPSLFFNVSGLSFPKFVLLPFLSSFTGIGFWLGVSKVLARAFKGNRVIRYVGQNTWTVMMHHPFSFFAVNCILWGLSGSLNLAGFDQHAFQTNIWYTYSPNLPQFAMVYVVVGVALPLLVKYGVEKLVLSADEKFFKNQHKNGGDHENSAQCTNC